MTLRKISFTLCIALTFSLLGTDAFAHNTGNPSSSIGSDKVVPNEPTRPALTTAQWKSFGDRLTESMASDNRGVQIAALRLAAYHGDDLQLGRQASINAVRMYRDNPDPNVRKLAVVAIAKMNHPWGIEFLERSLEFEQSAGVEKVMRNALNERAPRN